MRCQSGLGRDNPTRSLRYFQLEADVRLGHVRQLHYLRRHLLQCGGGHLDLHLPASICLHRHLHVARCPRTDAEDSLLQFKRAHGDSYRDHRGGHFRWFYGRGGRFVLEGDEGGRDIRLVRDGRFRWLDDRLSGALRHRRRGERARHCRARRNLDRVRRSDRLARLRLLRFGRHAGRKRARGLRNRRHRRRGYVGAGSEMFAGQRQCLVVNYFRPMQIRNIALRWRHRRCRRPCFPFCRSSPVLGEPRTGPGRRTRCLRRL